MSENNEKETTFMCKTQGVCHIKMKGNSVLSIDDMMHPEKLPIYLKNYYDKGELTPEIFNNWLKNRIIPTKRPNYKNFEKMAEGLIRKDYLSDNNLQCLTDQYWIRRMKMEKWEKINFFNPNNPWNDDVGLLFFKSDKIIGKKNFSVKSSPDLTTGGFLTKRWIRNEDKTKQYLIKQSSSSGQEVLNEVLSSFIMKKINILPFVEYTYYIDNLNLCSKCENFINESTEFVPAIDIYESCFPADKGVKSINDILKNLKYAMKKNGLDKYLDMIDKMIAVDIILCNKDRHINNFGFIKNIDSGEIIAFAPLFDFGASFLFKGERKINIFESYRDIGLKVIKKYGIVDTIEKNLPEIRKIINNYILLTLDEKEFIIRSFEKNLKSL